MLSIWVYNGIWDQCKIYSKSIQKVLQWFCKISELISCYDEYSIHRADSRLAPSQREMSLQSNGISHWLGANLKSALRYHSSSLWHTQLAGIDISHCQMTSENVSWASKFSQSFILISIQSVFKKVKYCVSGKLADLDTSQLNWAINPLIYTMCNTTVKPLV